MQRDSVFTPSDHAPDHALTHEMDRSPVREGGLASGAVVGLEVAHPLRIAEGVGMSSFT